LTSGASIGACAASYQSIYEGDIRFEHCYRVDEDPHQFRNLWDDPGYRSVRSDLVADLYDSLPEGREPKLPVSRPA